eukprot:Tbor_TRINITY_DN903_c0_g1::TRINITY_DN903_c0_g1_i1::g.21158::m.21158
MSRDKSRVLAPNISACNRIHGVSSGVDSACRVTNYPDENRSKDLLIETRKLLNVLNDENVELKQQNEALSKDILRYKSEKERSETDMKRINTNLSADLKIKNKYIKDLQVQLSKLNSETLKESKRSTVSMTRCASLDDENASLREEVKGMESKIILIRQQLTIAEETAVASNIAAKNAARGHQEVLEMVKKSFSERLEEMERDNERLSFELNERVVQLDSVTQELEGLREGKEGANIVLDEVVRKARAVDAESQFARSQLGDVCELAERNLADVSTFIRSVASDSETTQRKIEEQHHNIQKISLMMGTIRSTDDALIQCYNGAIVNASEQIDVEKKKVMLLEQKCSDKDQEIKKIKSDLARYNSEVKELTTIFTELQESVEKYDSDNADLKVELAKAQEEIKNITTNLENEQKITTTLRTELGEAKHQLNRVKDGKEITEIELSKEKSIYAMHIGQLENRLQEANHQLNMESDKMTAMRDKYESEISDMQDQLDEHTRTLSEALGRLTGLGEGSQESKTARQRRGGLTCASTLAAVKSEGPSRRSDGGGYGNGTRYSSHVPTRNSAYSRGDCENQRMPLELSQHVEGERRRQTCASHNSMLGTGVVGHSKSRCNSPNSDNNTKGTSGSNKNAKHRHDYSIHDNTSEGIYDDGSNIYYIKGPSSIAEHSCDSGASRSIPIERKSVNGHELNEEVRADSPSIAVDRRVAFEELSGAFERLKKNSVVRPHENRSMRYGQEQLSDIRSFSCASNDVNAVLTISEQRFPSEVSSCSTGAFPVHCSSRGPTNGDKTQYSER